MFHSLCRAKSRDSVHQSQFCEEKGEPKRGVEWPCLPFACPNVHINSDRGPQLFPLLLILWYKPDSTTELNWFVCTLGVCFLLYQYFSFNYRTKLHSVYCLFYCTNIFDSTTELNCILSTVVCFLLYQYFRIKYRTKLHVEYFFFFTVPIFFIQIPN